MQHCHWQDYEGSWNIDFLQYAGLQGHWVYVNVSHQSAPVSRAS